MSWVICDSTKVRSVITTMYYIKYIPENEREFHWIKSEWTDLRDDAKRFETKADAKAVQDQYGLGGSIIPA